LAIQFDRIRSNSAGAGELQFLVLSLLVLKMPDVIQRGEPQQLSHRKLP